MSFPQRLNHERLVKGWSIEQLSQASGVTVNRISMLERNLVEMVSDSLKAQLSKALGVNFQDPPSVALGTLQTPASPKPVAPPVAAAPALPEPLALHLPMQLQQQLEAAAHAQGRSLHGEVLARLEASLLGAAPLPSTPLAPHDRVGVIQLSEADLAHITEQVALRLQAQP